LTEAVRRRGREGAARDYPDRDALVPWQTVAVGVVLFVGYQGCQAYFIDYKDGRKAGVARVQSMAAGGVFVRDGMTPAKALTMVPADPNASPDWNAGFRDGFKEELERLYPQARK
jgi:hypothetical protein